MQGRTGEDVVCCFVPTTPNPTSGFIIVVPRKDITVLDMEVDEALKMIISLGVVVPTWKKDKTGELPFDVPDKACLISRTARRTIPPPFSRVFPEFTMRSHYCGEIDESLDRPGGRRLRLGSPTARPRWRDLHRSA